MAISSLRLRRTITTVSSVINHHRSPPPIPSISPSSPSSSLLQTFISSSSLPLQSRLFRSSSTSLSSARSYNNRNEDDKISPDTILFEGCDYNHWLITMDFPKDPKPTAEEMVETYVQTCAKGLNISVEEAKKKMYACSTTTYQGFQALMTEQESEQFRGLPGVVFILPDSYIDPVNKEYGGDKYINGTIIPRPPPVQYGRNQGRNRNFDRPRYDQQGNPPYNQRGPMQRDGRRYGPPQYPQQNNGPAALGERRGPMPSNNAYYAPEGRSGFQGERRDTMPSHQGNYNQADQRRFAPPEQRDFRADNRSYAPPHGGNYGQGAGGPYVQGPGAQGQGSGGGFGQVVGESFGQGTGSQGLGASYGQSAGSQGIGGSYGHGTGSQGLEGSYGQGTGSQGVGGSYGQGTDSQGVGGSYGGQGAGSQGAGGSYGQSYPGQGEGQRVPPTDQRNYGQTGTDHGR